MKKVPFQQKKKPMAILVSDKADFKARKNMRALYNNGKESPLQEDITILNVYMPNNRE